MIHVTHWLPLCSFSPICHEKLKTNARILTCDVTPLSLIVITIFPTKHSNSYIHGLDELLDSARHNRDAGRFPVGRLASVSQRWISWLLKCRNIQAIGLISAIDRWFIEPVTVGVAIFCKTMTTVSRMACDWISNVLFPLSFSNKLASLRHINWNLT